MDHRPCGLVVSHGSLCPFFRRLSCAVAILARVTVLPLQIARLFCLSSSLGFLWGCLLFDLQVVTSDELQADVAVFWVSCLFSLRAFSGLDAHLHGTFVLRWTLTLVSGELLKDKDGRCHGSQQQGYFIK